MTQPELVLDLSVDGLSLWHPADATDWTLLGFASLEDSDLSEKIAAMRQAGVAAAGPDFATMLLLPDDHIWVQRLHLKGLTANALDASARQALAAATSLPTTGFSLAFGDVGPDGATSVAATTTEVLEEARKFARDNGFNPKSVASRSFFAGFSTRAVFGDAPRPLAFLPRMPRIPPGSGAQPDLARPPDRRPFIAEFTWPKLPKLPKLPSIRREWLFGGLAGLLILTATLYWAIDPYEQFLAAPDALDNPAEFALPDDPGLPPSAPAALAVQMSGQLAPDFAGAALPAPVILSGLSGAAGAGGTQVAVSFDAEGVYFAQVPTPPKPPAGLGAVLAWTAPAAMFLEAPGQEPAIGVAALQKLPVLEAASAPPQDSGFRDNVLLTAVPTRSAGGLAAIGSDPGLALPSADAAEFAYRDPATVLDGGTTLQLLAAIEDGNADGLIDRRSPETLQLAALGGPVVPFGVSDRLIATPAPAAAAPGTRPLPRPDGFSVILPSEAAAALTPANTTAFIGPAWLGPGPTVDAYLVTEFVAGRPGHVRPQHRPGGVALVPVLAAIDRPVFGPDWPGQPFAAVPAGAVEFDAANPAHLRPLPRSAEMLARVAAAAAQESILALNLPATAALDVGLGWQEFNPDNPAHVRPQVRPASLQQLAERGDLAPTALALPTSIRSAARPSGIAAIMLARAEEIEAAQAAAAEAELRAQSVAAAAALALAGSEPPGETAAADLDPDLAALDDAEPETDVQVASLPTSASVAEAATTDGDLERGAFNLIGIYGTESKRRALIRLPSGRYERVTVGDVFSGWKVVAIGDDAIRLAKGGKDAILRMPR